MTSVVFGQAAAAAEAVAGRPLDLTRHWTGIAGLALFVVAYLLVMNEEKLHLRKSKPVLLAAGIIWGLIGVAYALRGDTLTAAAFARRNLEDFGEIFLFLLVAMTFVNTMEERLVFDAFRSWLVRRGFSLRAVFWATGLLAFFISAMIDNMTTALVVGTVALTVGKGDRRFLPLACINIVVAANAGGAFCPFGDITTLMVWQAGLVGFWQFFRLFVPSVVNWLVPAVILSLALPAGKPAADAERVRIRPGGLAAVVLFAVTIVITVTFYNLLGLPPVLGMMTGLGLLNMYGFWLRRRALLETAPIAGAAPLEVDAAGAGGASPERVFDIFRILQRAEWDTLMFFYGVIMCVGGLATIGYLAGLSRALYTGVGATPANVVVGAISAVIDNIPVMFSVIRDAPRHAARAVAARHPHRRRGRLDARHRQRGGGSAHGAVPRRLHVPLAPPLDLGRGAGVCRRHLGSPAAERVAKTSPAATRPAGLPRASGRDRPAAGTLLPVADVTIRCARSSPLQEGRGAERGEDPGWQQREDVCRSGCTACSTASSTRTS